MPNRALFAIQSANDDLKQADAALPPRDRR
jgi:hypothetical protein